MGFELELFSFKLFDGGGTDNDFCTAGTGDDSLLQSLASRNCQRLPTNAGTKETPSTGEQDDWSD
jgi:hypothetical protein